MHRIGAVVFSLLLACPLFAWPGFGYDAVRLPAVLGLLALLLGRQALSEARRPERETGRDPLLLAAFILSAAFLLSLLAAPAAGEAPVPVLVLLAGVAAYAHARTGLLPRAYVFSVGVWVVAGVGVAFSAVGLVQQSLGGAAVSTEGNTNYAGAMAAMLLPPAVSFSLLRAPLWKRALAASGAVALFTLLLLSDSRGGLAGALAGIVLMGVILVLKRVPRSGKTFGIAVLLLVAVPAALQGPRHFSEARVETVSWRLEIWKSAGRMFLYRPWGGVGPGNFAAHYPPYRSEAEYRLSHKYAGRDFKEVEDAHSSWVQVAVETGVPGLLALLLVVIVSARVFVRYVKAAPDPDYAAVLAGLGGGAAAYLVSGFFNTLTPHVSPTVLFWAFLGLAELAGNPRAEAGRRRARWEPLAVPAAALAGLIAAGWTAALAYSDWAFTAGMRTTDPGRRETYLLKALSAQPRKWRARYELGRTYENEGRFQEAAEAYRETLQARPFHAAALNNLAVALLRAGSPEQETEAWLRRAIDVVPYYYLSYYNLGSLEYQRRRYPEARKLFARSADLNGAHARSHFGLGETYLMTDDAPGAREEFRRARELGMDVASALRQEHPSTVADPVFAEFFR